jgi:hypothetical protein
MAPSCASRFRRPAGAVAQLGERRNRTAEVRGSNPLSSTSNFKNVASKRLSTFNSGHHQVTTVTVWDAWEQLGLAELAARTHMLAS